MVSVPMPRNTTTVTTLISAIQYSVSPYTRTEAVFNAKMMARNSRLQAQVGISSRSGCQ